MEGPDQIENSQAGISHLILLPVIGKGYHISACLLALLAVSCTLAIFANVQADKGWVFLLAGSYLPYYGNLP